MWNVDTKNTIFKDVNTNTNTNTNGWVAYKCGCYTLFNFLSQNSVHKLCKTLFQCGMSFHNTVDCAQFELCIMWIAAKVNCAFHGLFTKCVQETAPVDM